MKFQHNYNNYNSAISSFFWGQLLIRSCIIVPFRCAPSHANKKMAHLFRELSLGHSKRETTPPPPPPSMASTIPSDLPPSPLGQLAVQFSESDLRLIAYEIFVAACRSATGKPLSSAVSSVSVANPDSPSNGASPASPAAQRSLTAAAASKMKKALGMKSLSSLSPGSTKSPGSGSGSGGKSKRPTTVGELMRIQMRVSESVDSRVRRAFLRIAASQVSSVSLLH